MSVVVGQRMAERRASSARSGRGDRECREWVEMVDGCGEVGKSGRRAEVIGGLLPLQLTALMEACASLAQTCLMLKLGLTCRTALPPSVAVTAREMLAKAAHEQRVCDQFLCCVFFLTRPSAASTAAPEAVAQTRRCRENAYSGL